MIRPEGNGTWTYIDLPFDAVAEFGKKGQVKVKGTVAAPADFARALAANAAAKGEFNGFPYSHKKEMVDWICDAKRVETRKRRIALAIERLVAGTA